jgi:amidase/6-aminohexanoate-cyclic-dimer hydrolase
MSWGEWAQHDGTALAARVRRGEVTSAELAAQAAAGIAKVDPALSGVVEVFEDVIADPAKDGTDLEGRLPACRF